MHPVKNGGITLAGLHMAELALDRAMNSLSMKRGRFRR